MSSKLQERPQGIHIEWIEFKDRIYIDGVGYVESVAMADWVPEISGRARCLSYWMEDEYWGFLFKGESACMVHANSVRYIKMGGGVLPEVKREQKGVTEVLDSAEHLRNEMVHGTDSTPKRRGRPPKARTE